MNLCGNCSRQGSQSISTVLLFSAASQIKGNHCVTVWQMVLAGRDEKKRRILILPVSLSLYVSFHSSSCPIERLHSCHPQSSQMIRELWFFVHLRLIKYVLPISPTENNRKHSSIQPPFTKTLTPPWLPLKLSFNRFLQQFAVSKRSLSTDSESFLLLPWSPAAAVAAHADRVHLLPLEEAASMRSLIIHQGVRRRVWGEAGPANQQESNRNVA